MIAFILVLIRTTWIFIENYDRHLEPQVNRAVIQVARLLPQLEHNEAMLADAYDQMIQSWERVFDENSDEYTKYITKQDEVISIKDIRPWTKPEDLELYFSMIEPHRFARQNLRSKQDVFTYFRMISFGAKDMVSDIIAGFFTLFEGSYKVGDFITVGNWYGTVVEIGLRTTKVRFFSETKIFNNSSMRDIINADGPVARMILNVPIAYDAALPEVEAVLAEELPKLTDVIPGLVKSPVYEGVESFEDSSVLLRIALYVNNSVKYPALRALRREVKLIFDRRGIEIPFNQLVIHEGKEGGGDTVQP